MANIVGGELFVGFVSRLVASLRNSTPCPAPMPLSKKRCHEEKQAKVVVIISATDLGLSNQTRKTPWFMSNLDIRASLLVSFSLGTVFQTAVHSSSIGATLCLITLPLFWARPWLLQSCLSRACVFSGTSLLVHSAGPSLWFSNAGFPILCLLYHRNHQKGCTAHTV